MGLCPGLEGWGVEPHVPLCVSTFSWALGGVSIGDALLTACPAHKCSWRERAYSGAKTSAHGSRAYCHCYQVCSHRFLWPKSGISSGIFLRNGDLVSLVSLSVYQLESSLGLGGPFVHPGSAYSKLAVPRCITQVWRVTHHPPALVRDIHHLVELTLCIDKLLSGILSA